MDPTASDALELSVRPVRYRLILLWLRMDSAVRIVIVRFRIVWSVIQVEVVVISVCLGIWPMLISHALPPLAMLPIASHAATRPVATASRATSCGPTRCTATQSAVINSVKPASALASAEPVPVPTLQTQRDYA